MSDERKQESQGDPPPDWRSELGLGEEEKNFLDALWPNVSTLEGARDTSKLGALMALGVAIVTFMLWFLAMRRGQPVFHVTAWSAVDGVLFFLISARLLERPSRIAAIACLGLYIGRQGYQHFMLVPFPWGTLLALLTGVYLFNAVRASFSYHRLVKANRGSEKPRSRPRKS